MVEFLVVFISFSTVSMRRNRGVCMCIYFYDVWCGIPKTRPHIPTFNICWSFFFVRGRPHCCYFFTYSLAISLCTPWCTLFIPFNFLYVTFLFLFIFQKHIGHKIPFNTSERKKWPKKWNITKKNYRKKGVPMYICACSRRTFEFINSPSRPVLFLFFHFSLHFICVSVTPKKNCLEKEEKNTDVK